MSKILIPLEDVRVASPCHADWEIMDGNDRVKLCGSCRKNVYNLSNMTRFDAEELITEKEGHLCVRYYQRADGTILTQDCPIGLAKARRLIAAPLKWLMAGTAVFVVPILWVFGYQTPSVEDEELAAAGQTNLLRDTQPFKAIADWVCASPTPRPEVAGTEVMGELSVALPSDTEASPLPPPPESMPDVAIAPL